MNKTERAERESALLAVALDCYASNHWDSVSIASIAKKAGVAKGTVYLHFSSKNEIFALLAMQFYEGLAALSRKSAQEIGHAGGSGRSQLEALINHVFLYARQEQKYRHIVQYCQREYFKKNIDPQLAVDLTRAECGLQDAIADCFHRGGRDASLPATAKSTTAGIFCTIIGAMNLLWSDRKELHENQMDYIAGITGYILSSIGSRERTRVASDGLKTKTSVAITHPPLDLVLES